MVLKGAALEDGCSGADAADSCAMARVRVHERARPQPLPIGRRGCAMTSRVKNTAAGDLAAFQLSQTLKYVKKKN